ncbi:hypothetical protein WN944_027200 [Citrus x changshan-huyou]|uniref:Uncharacterized protein n=1 Tax=Citrus x changshan-huyou TaxID=2935761 RepID=A0AAP0LLI1_9ROSI
MEKALQYKIEKFPEVESAFPHIDFEFCRNAQSQLSAAAADAVKQLIPESVDDDLLPSQRCGLSKRASSSSPQTE